MVGELIIVFLYSLVLGFEGRFVLVQILVREIVVLTERDI